MRDLIDHDPYPVVLFDPNGAVSYANSAARELVPGSRLDHLSDLLPAGVAAALRTRGAAMIERREGPRSAWQINARLPDGRMVSAVVAARGDAAEGSLVLRMRVDEATGNSESLLRRLVAHTPGTGQTYFEQLVVHLTEKLKVKYAFVSELDPGGAARTIAMCKDGEIQSPLVYQVVGTPCEEAATSGICYLPEDAAMSFPEDRLLGEMGIYSYLGVPLVTASGEVIGVLALMHDAPMDEALDPVGFVRLFAARTATEIQRQRAENEAERQRQLADRLLDQVDALVLVLDGEGRVVRANRTVGRVTGWSEADLLGEHLSATFASARAGEAVQAALDNAIPVMIEDTWRTPTGEQREIRWQVRPMAVGDGTPRHLLVTGVDLTALQDTRRERDALQDRLRQARRLESLGRLAGGVAHDFNNLLLAILGYADLIQSNPDSVSEVQSSAREIRRAADLAASLTRQLLAFGRRQRLERRGLDLVEVIESATAVLRPLLPDGVELVVEVPDVAVPVKADPSRLAQVLVNLGANARDAMPDGGTLSMRATVLPASRSPLSVRGRPVALIEVCDTGTGIDETVLPHIFEPFFTTKELGQGTGLGLASVYGTVQQHGGTVDVKTGSAGTTFRIFLPIDAIASVDPPTAPDCVAGPGAGRRILVAEDDERVRNLVGRLLEGAGYRVVSRPDGAEAWEEFQAHPTDFDLVLADVLMPRLGGVDLATRIRAHSPDKPVMLTSGFVADLSDFPIDVRLLPKPYMPDELLSAVGEALAAS